MPIWCQRILSTALILVAMGNVAVVVTLGFAQWGWWFWFPLMACGLLIAYLLDRLTGGLRSAARHRKNREEEGSQSFQFATDETVSNGARRSKSSMP